MIRKKKMKSDWLLNEIKIIHFNLKNKKIL